MVAFALDRWQRPEVMAVEIHDVEGDEGHASFPSTQSSSPGPRQLDYARERPREACPAKDSVDRRGVRTIPMKRADPMAARNIDLISRQVAVGGRLGS